MRGSAAVSDGKKRASTKRQASFLYKKRFFNFVMQDMYLLQPFSLMLLNFFTLLLLFKVSAKYSNG